MPKQSNKQGGTVLRQETVDLYHRLRHRAIKPHQAKIGGVVIDGKPAVTIPTTFETIATTNASVTVRTGSCGSITIECVAKCDSVDAPPNSTKMVLHNRLTGCSLEKIERRYEPRTLIHGDSGSYVTASRHRTAVEEVQFQLL